jgi:DNA invertase Pin-like site-specific DNA recombinase
MKRYVAYYRVWPKKSCSSVELATQSLEARRFISHNGGRLLAAYTDRENKRGDRPEFAKAVEHAIRSDAVLVIAHLGRLSRNVPFTHLLLESHVDFVCLDDHEVNRRTIHIMASVAQEETRKVSDRAKTALAAAKARGVKLGCARPGHWDGREHLRGTKKAIAAAAKKKREVTKNTYAFLMPEIKARRERGETLPEIMDWLNGQGRKTTAGKPFTQTAVWRLIDRYLGKEWLGNIKKRTQGSKVNPGTGPKGGKKRGRSLERL